MEYNLSEVRLDDVQAGVQNEELIELSMEALGQVGGGGVVLNE